MGQKPTDAGLLPVAAVAGRVLGTPWRATSPSPPSKPRSGRIGMLRRRRLVQAATALLGIWLCWRMVAPAGLGQLQEPEPAVWPSDAGAQALAARRQFLRQQQAIRHTLAEQRAAVEQRPYTGFLPDPPPKVALMFLVRGNMPLEPVWKEFFAAAAQVEPVALPPPFAQLAQRKPLRGQRQQQQQRRRLAGQAQQLPFAMVEAGTDNQGTEQRQQEGHAMGKIHDVGRNSVDAVMRAAEELDAAVAARAARHNWRDLERTPLTSVLRQQVEANQQLEAALGQGKLVQDAQQLALRARSMEAPLSMVSPLDPSGPIAQQDLFSVYVHTMPSFYYKNTSIFSGYQIDRRVYVSWGQYTVAEAERRLVISALANPRNQRFVLISETCTPLYPPHVMYLQLLSDTKSRLNACSNRGGIVERWNSALYMPGLLTPHRWRKSGQWKSLTRAHAEIVASDQQLAPRFERECYSFMPPIMVRPAYVVAQNRTWVHRSCIADEHYIPTLLAVHRKDDETTCADALTVADWVPGLWSPKVHHGEEVNPKMIQGLRIRALVGCRAEEAIASAATMFRRHGRGTTLAGQPLLRGVGVSSSIGSSSKSWGATLLRLLRKRRLRQEDPIVAAQQAIHYSRLDDACFLLARKFAPDSVPFLLRLAEDCQEGTAISSKCLDRG